MTGRKYVFFDMDGTLTDFQYVPMETLLSRGYFMDLKPSEIVHVLSGLQKEGLEIHVLSAYLSESPYALAEKVKWCDTHIPQVAKEHRHFVPCGTDKAAYIEGLFGRPLKEDMILVDDHTPNLIPWQQRGGVGIKWINHINGMGGTWTGKRIQTTDALREALLAG